MAQYQPQHLLSKMSMEQDRNVFLWASGRLQGGLHVDERCSVSVKDFYRWISIISLEGDSLRFDLSPVEIIGADHQLLTYHMRSTGDALSRTSRESLLPGDYGAFVQDCPLEQYNCCSLAFPSTGAKLSYLQREEWLLINRPGKYIKYDVPPSIVKQVQIRDYRRCVMTGTSSNEAQVTVTWIYPPCFASDLISEDEEIAFQKNPHKTLDLTPFQHVNNVLTLREEITQLFRDNKCGVDVDDNYRIVFFGNPDKYKHIKPLLNLVTEGMDPLLRPSDRFLRIHFLHCLRHNIRGGDVTADYDDVDLDDFMERMDDKIEDMTDPDWQTPLGKEYWEMLIRQRLSE